MILFEVIPIINTAQKFTKNNGILFIINSAGSACYSVYSNKFQ